MTVHPIHDTKKPTHSIVYITPAMARRFLEKNTRNREIRWAHVENLMSEMTSGRWQYNGEAIKWSTNNEMLDGQHRMIAMSCMPDDFPAIPFLVVRDLPPQTQDTMDQGVKRSAADQLHIDGIINGTDGKTIAAAIRIHILWNEDRLFGDVSRIRVSNPQVIEWAKTHPAEVSLMAEMLCHELRHVKAKPSITLAVLFSFTLIDPEAAKEFSSSLYSGANLCEGHPILALRTRLDRIQEQKFKTSDRDMIAFFIVAWNAWRKGQKVTKFQRPHGGSWSRDDFPKAI